MKNFNIINTAVFKGFVIIAAAILIFFIIALILVGLISVYSWDFSVFVEIFGVIKENWNKLLAIYIGVSIFFSLLALDD